MLKRNQDPLIEILIIHDDYGSSCLVMAMGSCYNIKSFQKLPIKLPRPYRINITFCNNRIGQKWNVQKSSPIPPTSVRGSSRET